MRGWHVLFGILGLAWLDAAALQQAGEVVVQAGEHQSYGQYLTDSQGRSLYLFTRDTKDTSNCYDQCAQNWPPLLVRDKAAAGKGVDGQLLGTARRRDGTLQVTYNGWPLYYFARDQKAGDTNGQGVGGVWFLVSPKGEAIKAAAAQQPGGAQTEALLAQLKSEGQEVYARTCASCHGAQGQGGVGAALTNNSRLQNAALIVEAIVKGVGYMPPVGANLSNREIAAVATFVRTSFGNNYGLVTESDVARLR